MAIQTVSIGPDLIRYEDNPSPLDRLTSYRYVWFNHRFKNGLEHGTFLAFSKDVPEGTDMSLIRKYGRRIIARGIRESRNYKRQEVVDDRQA